jgi:uncharacterized protein
MRSILLLVLGSCLLLASLAAPAQPLQAVPALTARVTDLTNTLSVVERDAIEANLEQLETETGSQVAVLLVATTAPEAIEQYALRVVEQWELGREDIDDGVLFLVAMQDRKMRIEVGYGLEGALPDARAKRIIEGIVTPAFRAGDFSGGIAAGTDAIATVVRGEELPLPEPRRSSSGGSSDGLDLFGLLPVLLIFAFVFGGPLKRAIGSLPGALAAGGIAGFIGWLIVGGLGYAALIGVITFVISLFAPAGLGSWTSGGGGRRGGYGGGFGRGGGGFGGGGGSFGGGGASGGW